MTALDRYITGNYGEDQFKGYCAYCDKGTYIDNEWYDEDQGLYFCSKKCQENFYFTQAQGEEQ